MEPRSFYAVCVQRRSLFFLRFCLLDTIRFGLTGHLQVCQIYIVQQDVGNITCGSFYHHIHTCSEDQRPPSHTFWR
jgi:hypothetical protein